MSTIQDPIQTPAKSMRFGEVGLLVVFAALAFFSIIVAAKAYTPEYGFHAYLFAAFSIAAVFVIGNRYMDRPAEPIPQVINGKPNYNFDVVKVRTIFAVAWGIAGFLIGVWAALQLAFPAFNFDTEWVSSGVCVRCTPPR